MDNEFLKKVFITLHWTIAKNVNPDSVIDKLVFKDVITDNDFCYLYNIPDPASRCETLLSLLHFSPHPETFIQLRLALLDEYPSIVAEVDEQLSSLTTRQPQQPVMSQTVEGKLLRSLSHFVKLCQRHTGLHSLLTESCFTSSQIKVISLRSCCMVSIPTLS